MLAGFPEEGKRLVETSHDFRVPAERGLSCGGVEYGGIDRAPAFQGDPGDCVTIGVTAMRREPDHAINMVRRFLERDQVEDPVRNLG